MNFSTESKGSRTDVRNVMIANIRHGMVYINELEPAPFIYEQNE